MNSLKVTIESFKKFRENRGLEDRLEKAKQGNPKPKWTRKVKKLVRKKIARDLKRSVGALSPADLVAAKVPPFQNTQILSLPPLCSNITHCIIVARNPFPALDSSASFSNLVYQCLVRKN